MSRADRPLRVGILLRNRHDGPGGLEKVLEIVARAMPEKNVELKFYALYPPKYGDFTKEFGSLTYLPLSPSLSLLQKLMPAKLFRVLQKNYVKKHGMKLFRMMQADQLDLLITLDLSKQFLGNYEFLKTFKDEANIPILSWVHSSLSSNSPKITQAVKDRIHLFDGHLAISPGIAKELENDYGVKNVDVVFNPVNYAELIERDPRKFIYIGRIDANKRVDSLLVQLQKLVGDWSLDIYGSTGKKKKDQAFIQKIVDMGLADKVTFHGWKSDVWSEVKSAGVILLNSKKEGMPLVLVEAMMRGISVVSSDCPTGPADLVSSGENGWLYPVDEEVKIAVILQNILDEKWSLASSRDIQKSVKLFRSDNYLNSFIKKISGLRRNRF